MGLFLSLYCTIGHMVQTYEPDPKAVTYGEHTADIWMSASGATPEEVLNRMVEGLYATISESYILEEEIDGIDLMLSASSNEELMVKLLSEILFMLDSGSEVVRALIVKTELSSEDVGSSMTLRARRFRASILPDRRGMEVKAVTRHNVSFEPVESGWEARVLLDI